MNRILTAQYLNKQIEEWKEACQLSDDILVNKEKEFYYGMLSDWEIDNHKADNDLFHETLQSFITLKNLHNMEVE